MEGTFNSAKNQFKNGFVQHFLTGEAKYKTVYEAAQHTMDSILSQAPAPEPESNTKTTHEKSYTLVHQLEPTQPMSPSQAWKYWTLGSLLLLSTAVTMF